jgi:hypothetical protein
MNDTWEQIFEQGHLLDVIEKDGFLFITPDELKKLGNNREPRLLAKIDYSKSRPEIFKKHNLSILSVQNNKYVIFEDKDLKTYYSLKQLYDKIETEIYTPIRDFSEYHSLNLNEISLESQAIDYAYLVSLIKTFTGEKELFLTIRGRYGSNDFKINIPASSNPISVSGVQIEIDAGFESPEKIYILEAKIGRVDDFNIRQLYYPYKDWLLKTTKDVIPIFFIYTNGLFYLIQLGFGNEYGDLRVLKSKCYTINEAQKQKVNIKKLLESTEIEAEPDVPYPQANDIDKIIDLVINSSKGLTNKIAIADFFDFDERQGDYYANAAIYLGLLKRKDDSSEFELTRTGMYLYTSLNRNKRNYLLLQQMLKKPTFNEIISIYYYNGDSVNIDNVAQIIQKYVNINKTTARRRASTVIQWIKWINDNIEFY